jgi:hypothetical protein
MRCESCAWLQWINGWERVRKVRSVARRGDMVDGHLESDTRYRMTSSYTCCIYIWYNLSWSYVNIAS